MKQMLLLATFYANHRIHIVQLSMKRPEHLPSFLPPDQLSTIQASYQQHIIRLDALAEAVVSQI